MPDTLTSSWNGLGYHDWFGAQRQDVVPSTATMTAYYDPGKPAVYYEPPCENYG